MNETRKRQVILVVAVLWSVILFLITNKSYDKYATLFGAFIGPILVFPISGWLQGYTSNMTHPSKFGSDITMTYMVFALYSSPIMIALSIFNFVLTLKIRNIPKLNKK